MTGYYAYNTKPTINDQMILNFAEKPVWTNNNCACLRKHKWSHPVLRLAPNFQAHTTLRVSSFFSFPKSLLPHRTLSSPPGLRWMRVVGAIGQTHPSHWLGFWGETSLWCNHPPNLAFRQEWFSVLAAEHTFNGVSRFRFVWYLSFLTARADL